MIWLIETETLFQNRMLGFCRMDKSADVMDEIPGI